LTYKQLVELGIRIQKGVLKKKYVTHFLSIEGRTGRIVRFGETQFLEEGLSKLVGLKPLQVEVLKRLETDHDSSTIDLASRLGEPIPLIRRQLPELEKRHLVRGIQAGKSKLFRRVVGIPNPSLV
jgi:hypothetical protein